MQPPFPFPILQNLFYKFSVNTYIQKKSWRKEASIPLRLMSATNGIFGGEDMSGFCVLVLNLVIMSGDQ